MRTTVDGRAVAPKKRQERLVAAAITAELWERFTAFCKSNNTSQSRVIRELIEECLKQQDNFSARNGGDEVGSHSGVRR